MTDSEFSGDNGGTDARTLVFRHATVVSVDPAVGTVRDTDVLVVGDSIAAIGVGLAVPEGTREIDASGGILMPGMIDTHRHMYQTALRGFGADWTLTDYFYFYYINHGHHFRPQDVYAGNLLAAVESLDSGVTTTLDWSHGLRTVEYGEAAVAALQAVPGRFVFAYGNFSGSPADWATTPEFRAFARQRAEQQTDMLSFALAFDVQGDPSFPERAGFEAARELDVPVTTHSGVWGATSDAGIDLIAENGFLTDRVTHVHAGTLSPESYRKIAAAGGSVSLSAESEASAGQGYLPGFRARNYGINVSLSVDTSSWWSADMFSAMRATANADRGTEHAEAHAAGETVTSLSTRVTDLVEFATIGGAAAIGRTDLVGSITVGKKADLVLVKNDASPTLFPILNPEGHLVFQAGRGDVHTVLVNGRVVKHEGKLLLDAQLAEARSAVAETVDYLQSVIGDEAWNVSERPAR
ncbi:amidohydrolase family protein [Subtercola lobariae]|uniref:Amidohydrolase n=1 Tax=Subtercola lobariae TaxID=1588641 RepID=A0A917F0X9_9MICO|nr:amidohydrolase family protein [Subtercola lobariae]GGF37419.1 amidohydrolase [Subtercola lobariae]